MTKPLNVIAGGHGDFLRVDPDGFREYVRDNKQRAMTPKLMTEKEPIDRGVSSSSETRNVRPGVRERPCL
jgi:hypothetical protein